eukprot:m.25066 g.25066  ORF g.25066 m.25066 type:complete len:274 (+) comp4207_c0_seq1:269-1090(+)
MTSTATPPAPNADAGLVPQSIVNTNTILQSDGDIDTLVPDYNEPVGNVASPSPDSPFEDLRMCLVEPPLPQSFLHRCGVTEVDLMSFNSDLFDGESSPSPVWPAVPSIAVHNVDANAPITPLVVPASPPTPLASDAGGRRLRSGISFQWALTFGSESPRAGKSPPRSKLKRKINPAPPKATEPERLRMNDWKESCGDDLMVLPLAEWQNVVDQLCAPVTPRDWELLMILRKQALNRKYQAVHKGKKASDYRQLQAKYQRLLVKYQELLSRLGS